MVARTFIEAPERPEEAAAATRLVCQEPTACREDEDLERLDDAEGLPTGKCSDIMLLQ